MTLKTAKRARIDPFIVMDVMRQANAMSAKGEDVVHLEVGQPSTPAPAKVLAAAKNALDGHRLGYTDALGIPELREAISRHYRDFYGLDVPSERVIVTTGSSGGFLLAFLASFDPGDRVALASPGYPCYRNILLALDIEPVIVPMQAQTKFQPDVDSLAKIDGPIDGLIIASPSNPVGAVIGETELRRIAEYCGRNGIRLISDEIYHGITYEKSATSIAGIDERAIVVNSFSKYFSMTGWRLGWLVAPSDLIRPIERLAQNLFISPPSLSQVAAIAAFQSHEELQANVRRYAANREVLLNDLPSAGFQDLIATDGAFYVYANVAKMTNDSVEFCARMLREARVAATPGLDFDVDRGRQWLRFSFAGSTEEMAEAVRRLASWRK